MAPSGAKRPHNPWMPAEDETMLRLIWEAGSALDWKQIANALGRHARQCRNHWNLVLDPSIKKGPWSPEEKRKIAQRHEKFGDSWAKISKQIPGRTDAQCRNYWIHRFGARYTTQGAAAPGGDETQEPMHELSSPDNPLAPGRGAQAENETLLRQVQEAGPVVSWITIAKSLPGRNARQCRIHWTENIDPSINLGPWSPVDDKLAAKLQTKFGDSWGEISRRMPGHTKWQYRNFLSRKASAPSTHQGDSAADEHDVQTQLQESGSADSARTRATWTPAEDERFLRLVRASGPDVYWRLVANALPGRTTQACHTHWTDGSP